MVNATLYIDRLKV